MEYSLTERYEYMNEVLTKHNFTMNDTSEDVKCIICKKLMINACQGSCGCNYCYKCINDHISTGAKFCPGNTADCEEEDLSKVVIDHKMNKKISLLTVKCPDELCSYQCQLKNMIDHLRTCFIDNVYCPFHDIGCDHNKISNDQFHQHMINEMYNHSKMLVSEIGNIKNEMAEWKRNEMKYVSEINDLKINDELKNKKIKSLEEILDFLKIENDKLLLDSSNKLEEKIEIVQGFVEMVSSQAKIEIIKSDDKLNKAILDFHVSLCDMNTALTENLKKEITKIDRSNKICSDKMEANLDQWRKYVDKELTGIFIWKINDIEAKRWSDQLIMSDFFYSKMAPYKMRLGFLSCGLNMFIRLHLYSGPADEFVKWPFKADVTMTITSDIFSVSNQCISMMCVISRPGSDSFSSSDGFSFSFNDLKVSGLMLGKSLVIECSIDIK